jgi:alkylation response protein AidB-like acyl-CoA dehydrogenase
MDFAYTADQKLIKEAARDFLTKECPSDLVREMEKDEKGFPPALWHKIAELGWLGLLLPEEYGGSGPSFFDLVVLLEEMGRFLVPVPLLPTVILGGLAVLQGGTKAKKQEILPKIATGELILTTAFSELDVANGVTGGDYSSVRKGDRWVIHGTRLFVPYSHVADYLVCPVQTGKGSGKEDGITLFLIGAKNPGVSHTVLETLACEKQCEVVLSSVTAEEEHILGEHNRGSEILKTVLEQGTIGHCAWMVGGAEKVLEMTLAHAKQRIQFNRPIASFQAIQHRFADMKADLEGARSATYEAAWRVSQGLRYTLEASVAKVWVNQAYNRMCARSHQIYGGSGVMKDYDIELYTRRAKAAEFFLGDTQFHREIIAEELGL